MNLNIESQEDANYARQQWEILANKSGLPEAAKMRASGINFPQMHESRKTMRRAVNQIVAKLNPGDYDAATSAALYHAGKVIADISTGIDHIERTAENKNTPSIGIMRNAADFAKHYRSNEQFDRDTDGDMGIADLLRGVANMSTSLIVRNALSTGTDSAGGFSVPSRLMPGILSAMVPVSLRISEHRDRSFR